MTDTSGRSVSASFPADARALATTIAWLRPLATLGQILTVAAAILWLLVDLSRAELAAGIAVFARATPVAFWRLRQPWPRHEREAFCHLAFDMLLLGWALYFTGGASNAFITLLLAPVALSAAALSGAATIPRLFRVVIPRCACKLRGRPVSRVLHSRERTVAACEQRGIQTRFHEAARVGRSWLCR